MKLRQAPVAVAIASFAALAVTGCGGGGDERQAALEAPAEKGELGTPASLPEQLRPPAGPSGAANLRVDRDSDGNPYVSGELIITYADGVDEDEADEITRNTGASVTQSLGEGEAELVELPKVEQSDSRTDRERGLERTRSRLDALPEVASADYNYLREPLGTPNDTYYGSQWGLGSIKAATAWDTSNGSGTRIAIIDTGINDNNPDIAGAVLGAWDYAEGDSQAQETDGHGTHVAGIAAAYTNNGKGVAGTSPGGYLLDLKAARYNTSTKDYRFPDAAVISALYDAGDYWGADVVNMSFGSLGAPSASYEAAINDAWADGVVVVAAAGNDDSNQPHYPSSYSNAISVSAVKPSGTISSYSNYGSQVDIAAPGGAGYAEAASEGEKILSTVGTGYAYKSGTSMASPYVAGVASLLAAQGLSASSIRSTLEATASDIGRACRDDFYGNGLVNAAAAVGAEAPANGRCASCQAANARVKRALKKHRRARTRASAKKLKKARRAAARRCG